MPDLPEPRRWTIWCSIEGKYSPDDPGPWHVTSTSGIAGVPPSGVERVEVVEARPGEGFDLSEVEDAIREVVNECEREPRTNPLRSLIDRLWLGTPPGDLWDAIDAVPGKEGDR